MGLAEAVRIASPHTTGSFAIGGIACVEIRRHSQLRVPMSCVAASYGDGAQFGNARAMSQDGTLIGVSRRTALGLGLGLGLAVAFPLSWFATEEADAAVSRRVNLKDVENPKLQEALRAAVAGDLENAEAMFSALLQEDPESASVWSNRGSVRVSLQKFEQAADDFTRAIALAPDAPVPLLNRAISYEAMGRFSDAIGDCKAAIVNDPEEYAAWFNLGNVEVRVRDYDAALNAYSRASRLAPGIAGYRLKEALVLFELDRLEEARKLIQGLVRKYPNYTEAHAVLAAVLWKEGSRSKAEEQFSEATIREPRYSDIRVRATPLAAVSAVTNPPSPIHCCFLDVDAGAVSHWSPNPSPHLGKNFVDFTLSHDKELMNSSALNSCRWVADELQWPPGAMEAMSKFLNIIY